MACRSGKVEHPTHDAALEAQKLLVWLNHSRGQDERSAGLHVYPCDVCGAWHFGHSTQQTPHCYHYDVASALDAITDRGQLRPAKPRLSRRMPQLTGPLLAMWLSLEERHPLVWFSWSATWDPRSTTTPHPGHFVVRPAAGRLDEGIVRITVPAYVAKLRWLDYVALNKITPDMQHTNTSRGNPADWLATDQPVPSTTIRRLDVWCRGAWVDVDEATAEDVASIARS